MTSEQYVLSFTAGGLLYHESITVAETYSKCRRWDETINQIIDQNLLQSRVQSTTVRKLREICHRLKGLSTEGIELLINGSRSEQNMLLWLACCKRYKLLAEFAKEVLHDKFIRLDFAMTVADVDRFMDAKSLWHEELENITDNTKTKLQTVMMRMLREAELISKADIIQPKLLSANLVRVIANDSVELFPLFPISETDVKGVLNGQ